MRVLPFSTLRPRDRFRKQPETWKSRPELGSGRLFVAGYQRAARSITLVTAAGCDSATRWEAPGISVMVAWARLAMKRSAAGAMAWSPVGMTAYFGSVAGAVSATGSSKAEA